MKPIIQRSLDLTKIPEAVETARMALRAGVDWLEAGTPLIIAEGMNGVRALRHERVLAFAFAQASSDPGSPRRFQQARGRWRSQLAIDHHPHWLACSVNKANIQPRIVG